MACTCESVSCTQIEIEGVIYCECEIVIPNIKCPDDCTIIIREDGNVECSCLDTVTPNMQGSRTPIYFDNEEYFETISWTINYDLKDGTWSSFNTFYPDYSIAHTGYFQIGYNFGDHKETIWNHLLDRSSFCVFHGEKHIPCIEFPIANENVNKILNSISLNIEGVHYQNDWDWAVNKDISFKNLYIYNKTNNSGMLSLNPQKTLADTRKYPKTVGNIQEILFTSDQGKQNINYLYNRMVNQDNNIPMFNIDKNNIFKSINNNAVKFNGKRVLERLKGEVFVVHLEGMQDSRYGLILKNSINNETAYE